MTVKELIEELKKYDENLTIEINGYELIKEDIEIGMSYWDADIKVIKL